MIWSALFLSIFPLTLPGAIRHATPPQSQSNELTLQQLLAKAGDYCARLDRIALYFTCQEAVKEKIYIPYQALEQPIAASKSQTSDILKQPIKESKLVQNEYLYDYQLIHKEKIEEIRVLVRENGNPCKIENAPLKTQRFAYKQVVFGPRGLLSLEAQKTHVYTIKERTTIWGKPAIVVKVVPKIPGSANSLYGKVWLSPADGGVYRIEWEERSIENYGLMLSYARQNRAKPQLQFESEYQNVKNGIRFPSRYALLEKYVQPGQMGEGRRSVLKSELAVTYSQYKFFIVETEITY